MTRGMPETVVLDVDGTLVDSVHVHVVAWRAAFQDVGMVVPGVRLHGLIGMGGDKLVAAAAGEVAEHAVGDDVRARHQHHLDRLFHVVTAADGAEALITTLHERGIDVRVASSSDAELTDRLLDLVGPARHLLSRVVSGSDADADESKPDGALVTVALGGVDPAAAVVVGDTVWDVHAAHDAGTTCVAVRSGGVCDQALLGSGALAVIDDCAELVAHVAEHDEVPGWTRT